MNGWRRRSRIEPAIDWTPGPRSAQPATALVASARSADPRLAWLAREDTFLPPALARSLRATFRRIERSDARPPHPESGPGPRRIRMAGLGIPALIGALALAAIVSRQDARISPAHEASSKPAASSLAGPPAASAALPRPVPGSEVARISETARIQLRLAALGFFDGTPNGPWGPRSRHALRQFKSANGLPADDAWDEQTEAKLFAPAARKKLALPTRIAPTDAARTAEVPDAGPQNSGFDPRNLADTNAFVGRWAANAADCQTSRASAASIRIGLRGAEGHDGKCSFGPVRRGGGGGGGWQVKAVCSAEGISWNANIRLLLSGDRLIWSSERGTAVYVRCGRSRDGMDKSLLAG